ncbi:hypothetical protein B0T21DRAFT_350139 [Apiosordaria backusii]|uniref:Uncharacterized protein n=1 Tax=Apiosordaria backusii TaxID=314023 RepID=A0AA40B839_9PEZI|nr:hypothetical protein B0T21DRAFT_350139 [Apiosordaria backusii]
MAQGGQNIFLSNYLLYYILAATSARNYKIIHPTHTTTPSWDYTTYNHPRNHPRDTYTPFPGRVLQHEHHHPHEKRNGMMAGMDLMEMLGRARGGSVAVTRPLGSVSSSSSSSSSGRRGHRIDRYGKIGDKPTTENNGGGVVGGGKKYDVVRLDDVVGEPVGGLVDVDEDGDDDDDVGGGELKRGRMVVVEDLD